MKSYTITIIFVSSKFDLLGYLIRKITKSNYNHVALQVSSDLLYDPRGGNTYFCSPKRYNSFLYQTKKIPIKIASEQFRILAISIKQDINKFRYLLFLYTLMRKLFNPHYCLALTCAEEISSVLYKIGILKKINHTPQDVFLTIKQLGD